MVKGKPKSGKPWKGGEPARKLEEEWKQRLPAVSFEKRMAQKQEMLEARALEQQMQEEKAAHKRKAREVQKKKKERKERNQFASGTYQVVKDKKKLSKLSKRMRHTLAQMPRDVFYKVVHGKSLSQ